MRANDSILWLALLGALVLAGCPDTGGGNGGGDDDDATPPADAGDIDPDAGPDPDASDIEPDAAPEPDAGDVEPDVGDVEPDAGDPEPDAGDPCTPVDELCNGEDDDCDGTADEDFADLDDPCSAGAGVCVADGTVVCNAAGDGTACSAVPGEPGVEACNGVDDDCDGVADNGFDDLGDPCTVGVGACRSEGTVVCAEDGAGTVCDAVEGEDGLEVCNAIDDDCDGSTDEALAGQPCETGEPGVCSDGQTTCVDGLAGCEPAAEPGDEICDGLDNDCDGEIDDVPGIGRNCVVGVGGCATAGTVVCTPDGPSCDAEPGAPAQEICDGIDNDCDGEVDNVPGLGVPCAAGEGACAVEGTIVCTPDGPACSAVPGDESPEVCDGIDNDCDGVIDNPGVCVENCLANGDEDRDGLPDCADPDCAELVACSPRRVLLCGRAQRDLSTAFSPADRVVIEDGCEPDADTIGMAISRSGAIDPAVVVPWLEAGGQLITEFGGTDEVYNAVFGTAWPEGNFTGACTDNVNPAIRFNEDDLFWAVNGGLPLQERDTGCGYDLTGFADPEIVHLGGWTPETISLAYRDIGAGRFYLVESDWQDNQNNAEAFNAATRQLLRDMLIGERAPVTPIAPPGEQVALDGIIDPADTTWARPAEDCTPEPDNQHPYEVHRFVNATDGPQVVDITATFAGGADGDGFLHLFTVPFDAANPAGCLAGDDDGDQGPANSQFAAVRLEARQVVAVVVSTANGVGDANSRFIGPFDLTVATRDAPIEDCALPGDEDGNGSADCADPVCGGFPACVEFFNCADGVDNDIDGDVDCADPECVAAAHCLEGPDNCADGVDNDLDGLTDCAVPACADAPNCIEANNCADGVDNDLDGGIDCADPECIDAPNCVEAPDNCYDGVDNDLDGLADCDDPDCAALEICDIVAVCGGIVLPDDPREFEARDDILAGGWSDGGNDAFDGYGRLNVNGQQLDVSLGARAIDVGGVEYGVLSTIAGNVWTVTVSGPADGPPVDLSMAGNLGSDGSTQEARLLGQPGSVEMLRTTDGRPSDPPVYTLLMPIDREPAVYVRNGDNVTVTANAVRLPATLVVALSYAEDPNAVADAIAAGCSGPELVEGPQQDVPAIEVEGRGWRPCFTDTYGNGDPDVIRPVQEILDACPADQLMLACRPVGSDTLTLAGEGLRDEVLRDVGDGADAVNPHNGLDWYFSDAASWGFAPADAGVERAPCDIADGDAEGRLCWRTDGGFLDGGARCGATIGLEGDDGWERIVFQRGARPSAEYCGFEGDEDENGLADCADPVCVEDPICIEAGNCGDGVDNDLDEAFDCADDECVDDPICIEAGNCNDGVDNDLDGDLDCADEECVADPICIEVGNCGDGVDNDLDGAADCADEECVADRVCIEDANCDDGVDNDLDGLTDCEQPECAVQEICQRVGGLNLGVQQNVAEADLLARGFEPCYSSPFGQSGDALDQIRADCEGRDIAMACRPVGEAVFTLVAEGLIDEVFRDVGVEPDASHRHNDIEWYYSPESSWGFAPGGEAVARFSCDITEDQAPELRMCVHTGEGAVQSGYRCGLNDLNGAGDWERVLLRRNAVPIEPASAAFGHHGSCNTFNQCGDAQTCADAACTFYGFGTAVSFDEGLCQDLQNGDVPDIDCNLFNNLPDSLDENWRNSCNIPVVYNVLCTGGADPAR